MPRKRIINASPPLDLDEMSDRADLLDIDYAVLDLNEMSDRADLLYVPCVPAVGEPDPIA